MYRTQTTLALIALFVGLAHSFSWDVVLARRNSLEFYKTNGKITFSVKPSTRHICWVAYDPVYNRVLFAEKYKNDAVFSYDIVTNTLQSIVKLRTNTQFTPKVYEPATELIFGTVNNSINSFSLKPGCDSDEGNVVIRFEEDESPRDVAVDSCGGFIYWTTNTSKIERSRFNGSEREVVLDRNSMVRYGLIVDQQTQKMYWIERQQDNLYDFSIESADLNGNNRTTLYRKRENVPGLAADQFTISKDFIYWGDSIDIFYLPKNSSLVKDVKPKLIPMIHLVYNDDDFYVMATNYTIEEQTQGLLNCEALKNLLPSDCDSRNYTTDLSEFCVHGRKVCGESLCKCKQGYIGERCDVSVCQNYCLQGKCNACAEGHPTCRCNAGYSGKRCEINACQSYCLNNGVCTLNKDSDPVCQCTGDYEGERCESPVFLVKCFQTVSMLKDFLHADTTSLTLNKGVQSTCLPIV